MGKMDIIGGMAWVGVGALKLLGILAFIAFLGGILALKDWLDWKIKGYGLPFKSVDEYNMIIGRLHSMGITRKMEFERVIDDDPRHIGIIAYDPEDKNFRVGL